MVKSKITSALILILALLVMSVPMAAQGGGVAAEGQFIMRAYPCLQASSGLCATGYATGTLSGRVNAVLDTQAPNADGTLAYRGTITIISWRGVFSGTIEDGRLVPNGVSGVSLDEGLGSLIFGDGAGSFSLSSRVQLTDGTGIYRDASADLRITGNLNLVTNREVDDYRGTIYFGTGN